VEARLAAKSLLLGATTAGRRIIVVGERGHILLSDDQGKTWRQANVPTQATLTAVSFATPELGWAVGHDSTILATDDGGEDWRLQHEAPKDEQPLLDVWFRDPQNGYAIGAYGLFLVTINGGASWAAKQIGDEDFHFNGIALTNGGKFYMAGEAGGLYRSDDGGLNWKKLPSPYGGSYFGILALAGDRILIFGLRGRMYRSDDAGQTWVQILIDTEASLMGGRVLPDGRVVVVGLGGTLLISTDNGHSFIHRTRPDRQALATVLPGIGDTLLLFGEYGVTRDQRQ